LTRFVVDTSAVFHLASEGIVATTSIDALR
jgi:hypothetical protein